MVNEDIGIGDVSCVPQNSFSIIVYYEPSGLIKVLSKTIWPLHCSDCSAAELDCKLTKWNDYQIFARALNIYAGPTYTQYF